MMFLKFKSQTQLGQQDYVVRMPSFEQKDGFVYYRILVSSRHFGKVNVLTKRYSDIKAIHQKLDSLKNQLKLNFQLPIFPGRKLFGHTNTNYSSITQRMEELQLYLNNLFKIEELQDFTILSEFLPKDEDLSNQLLDLIPNKELSDPINNDEDNYNLERDQMEDLKQQFLDRCDLRDSLQQQEKQSKKEENRYKMTISPNYQRHSRYLFTFESYEMNDNVVLYSVVVRDVKKHDRWRFKTRYNNLRDINNALKQEDFLTPLPEFPKRQIFTITNDNPGLIESRREQLETYLNNVFSHPEISNNEICMYFIKRGKRQNPQKVAIKINQGNKCITKHPINKESSIPLQKYKLQQIKEVTEHENDQF